MGEMRRHVLIWVAPEFLKPPGMIRIFKEAGIFLPPVDELEEILPRCGRCWGLCPHR
jgi:hypothetical protein